MTLSESKDAFDAPTGVSRSKAATRPPDDPEKNINLIVSQTQWCINKKPNMIALPMWAHSLRWYCSMITGEVRSVEEDGEQQSKMAAPVENLPQHDYDHDKYIKEVDHALKRIVKKVQKNRKDHKASQADFKAQLNSTVSHFKSELERRGSKREDGTHAAWNAGMKNESNWYLPFSMANDGKVTARTFPTRGGAKMLAKIQAMVEAFWKDGKWRAA